MQFDKEIEIEERKIGSNHPVFIIAEIGVNHNGDLDIAKKMIETAKSCGVHSVKFQTFRTEEFMSRDDSTYQAKVKGQNTNVNTYEMFKKLELPLNWHKELFNLARQCGLIPLTSVADIESASIVDEFISAYKLSSEDFINYPLIDYLIKKNKPIIFSTGMADEEEIDEVLRLLKANNKKDAIFLHCVSIYPTPLKLAHLNRIKALQNKTKAIVGYSDHTEGILSAIISVGLGVTVIEKHFTLDKNLDGPDHYFSADPYEMSQLVKQIRDTERLLGNADLQISHEEYEARKNFRRSIRALRDLPKGHILTEQDICLKRPADGIHPKYITWLIGKKLRVPLKKNDTLFIDDV